MIAKDENLLQYENSNILFKRREASFNVTFEHLETGGKVIFLIIPI
jgi:hypothetical protein